MQLNLVQQLPARAAAVGRRLVVADDSPLYLELLVLALDEMPELNVVGTAADGREAVSVALERKADVVLLDIDMPLVDGFAAAVEIRRLRPQTQLLLHTGLLTDLHRRRAEHLGIHNVEFKPIDLEWIDAKLASVDGILCRFGFMHAVDPEAALRECRRVLRPGGKLVLAVWDVPEHNPWLSIMSAEAEALGLAQPRAEGEPGGFSLSAEGKVAGLLEDAGFDEPVVETVDLLFSAPSVDAWWETQRSVLASVRPLLDGLSPADHYRLREAVEARWAPYVTAGGAIAIPGRALGVVAEA